MDCCGMPMSAWPGGGLVCRCCQAKVGVPALADPNKCARAVTEVPVVVAAVPAVPDPFPVEQPKPSGFVGRVGGRKGGPK